MYIIIWPIVVKIVPAVILLFIGAGIERFLERRPRVISRPCIRDKVIKAGWAHNSQYSFYCSEKQWKKSCKRYTSRSLDVARFPDIS